MIVQAPPAIVVQAVRHQHRLVLGIRVNLDPAGNCRMFSAAELAVEPDLGPDGVDSCGSPKQARAIIRVFGRSSATMVRGTVRLTHERGVLHASFASLFGPVRWSVTVFNLLGHPVTVRGVA